MSKYSTAPGERKALGRPCGATNALLARREAADAMLRMIDAYHALHMTDAEFIIIWNCAADAYNRIFDMAVAA